MRKYLAPALFSFVLLNGSPALLAQESNELPHAVPGKSEEVIKDLMDYTAEIEAQAAASAAGIDPAAGVLPGAVAPNTIIKQTGNGIAGVGLANQQQTNIIYNYQGKKGLFDRVEMPQRLFNNIPKRR